MNDATRLSSQLETGEYTETFWDLAGSEPHWSSDSLWDYIANTGGSPDWWKF